MTEPTPKPNRRQLAKAATQAKVLAAARAAFETLGYEGANIRTIAKSAGMSTGAVFANWTDKAALYREVYGHDPITPEQGRAAFIVLRALNHAAGLEGETQDWAAAIMVVVEEAQHVLGEFPALPDEQCLDADEHLLSDCARAALDPAAAVTIRAEAEPDGEE